MFYTLAMEDNNDQQQTPEQPTSEENAPEQVAEQAPEQTVPETPTTDEQPAQEEQSIEVTSPEGPAEQSETIEPTDTSESTPEEPSQEEAPEAEQPSEEQAPVETPEQTAPEGETMSDDAVPASVPVDAEGPQAAVPDPLSSPVDTANSPSVSSQDKTASSHASDSFFMNMFTGRLARLDYFVANIYTAVFSIIGFVIRVVLKDVPADFIGFLILILAVIVGVSISIRRWHDLDKSGWYVILSIIPIVNIVADLILLFMPGTKGDNQYGSRDAGSGDFNFNRLVFNKTK
jgi:uncharacterized membrane protein YhaH (DUF805 family)